MQQLQNGEDEQGWNEFGLRREPIMVDDPGQPLVERGVGASRADAQQGGGENHPPGRGDPDGDNRRETSAEGQRETIKGPIHAPTLTATRGF